MSKVDDMKKEMANYLKAQAIMAIVAKMMFEVNSVEEMDEVVKDIVESNGDVRKVKFPVDAKIRDIEPEKLNIILRYITKAAETGFITGVDSGRRFPELQGIGDEVTTKKDNIADSTEKVMLDETSAVFSKMSKTLH